MRASLRSINRKELFCLAVLTIIAASIRFWKLREFSFWADEVFTVQDARDNSYIFSINPLIYPIVRFFISIFGLSEWSARFGPCIIGILAIPAFYFPIKTIFNRKTAIITSLFIAFSPWHLFWSQSVRGYSLAFLFSGLSAFTFHIALETDKLKFIIIALALAILSILSHFLSVMLIFAMFVYCALLWLLPTQRPAGLRLKNLAIFFGPFLMAGFILLIPKYFQYLISGWGHNQWNRSPMYILFTLVYGIGVPTAVIAALTVIGKLRLSNIGKLRLSNGNIDKRYLLLLCYAGAPLSISLLFSPFLNIAGYYLFFTAPAYFVLAACGCAALIDATPRNKLLGIAATSMIVLTFLSQDYLYFQFENGGRAKWREALYAVKSMMNPKDQIVVAIPRLAEYYLPDATIIRVEKVMSNTQKFEKEWNKNSQDVWIILNERSFQVLDRDMKFRNWVYSTSRLIVQYPLYTRVMNRTIGVYKFVGAH